MDESVFSAEQLKVPSELPSTLKAFAKEVIRFQPSDVNVFAKDYFTALTEGTLQDYLHSLSQQQTQDTGSALSPQETTL